jgi:hypothetical protein
VTPDPVARCPTTHRTTFENRFAAHIVQGMSKIKERLMQAAAKLDQMPVLNKRIKCYGHRIQGGRG